MSPKRILFLPAVALLLYLAIYSWNQRTDFLDDTVLSTGLEAAGAVLKTVRFAQDGVVDAWKRYLDLVNVREENVRLKTRLSQIETRLILAAEEKAELERLRQLLQIQAPDGWQGLGSRVLAGRMGSNAALVTVTIDRGYLTGATPGTPAMTHDGVTGRVLRAGPTTSTVLLLTDPGSRIAVVTQQSRVQGVLAGTGAAKPLELRFVSHNAVVNPGELLVTSGMDDAFPKGLPVGRIVSAGPSDLSPFQSVQANPLANIAALEEVLLLAKLSASPIPTVFVPEPEQKPDPKVEQKPEVKEVKPEPKPKPRRTRTPQPATPTSTSPSPTTGPTLAPVPAVPQLPARFGQTGGQ